MKKHIKLPFLYRYRFVIGYAILLLVFFGLLLFLPSIAPGGLSSSEMKAAVSAEKINRHAISAGNTVNLPYYLLQKFSIDTFGLSLYSIKLPSIIIGVFTALFLVLLLNRWYKSDVAIVGSILTTLSVAFLILAGTGTPTIMYIFWIAVLLWLGSKIVGNEDLHPALPIAFAFSLGLSLYTPHLIYIAIGIGLAGVMRPNLRQSLEQLKIYQIAISIAVFILTAAPLVVSCFFKHSVVKQLTFTTNFGHYFSNIANAFAPFFSFINAYDSIYLAPLFGLGTVALIIIGILASMGKFVTARNTVVSLLVIYAIIFSGLNQNVAISVVVPISILTAAGIESIIEKWHSLFPENPYAHVIGTLPVLGIILFIVFSDLSHFIFGYHYSPQVVKNFNDDISIITENLGENSVLVISAKHENYDFYKLLEKKNHIIVSPTLPEQDTKTIASYEKPFTDSSLRLKRIIASPKRLNSARLYIYEKNTTDK